MTWYQERYKESCLAAVNRAHCRAEARPARGLLLLAPVGKHFPEVLQPPVAGGRETGLSDATAEYVKGPSSYEGNLATFSKIPWAFVH